MMFKNGDEVVHTSPEWPGVFKYVGPDPDHEGHFVCSQDGALRSFSSYYLKPAPIKGVKKYKPRQGNVKAIRYTGHNLSDIERFVGEPPTDLYYRLVVGDYIVKGYRTGRGFLEGFCILPTPEMEQAFEEVSE